MRIGVIGTGAIGMPMTQQVLSHGFDVRVDNIAVGRNWGSSVTRSF